MAQCYDFMDRKAEALKCYEKAHRCGDRERMALPRLARLHQDLGDRRQAALYYSQMLSQSAPGPWYPKASGSGLSTEVVEALRFLMVFYREEGNLAECEACATQLLDTSGSEKDEAKAMLRDLRSSADGDRGGNGLVVIADDAFGLRLAGDGPPTRRPPQVGGWLSEQPGT